MEVGTRHDGLCDPLATDVAEVGAFSSRADDLSPGEILPVIHSRDSPAT